MKKSTLIQVMMVFITIVVVVLAGVLVLQEMNLGDLWCDANNGTKMLDVDENGELVGGLCMLPNGSEVRYEDLKFDGI